MLRKYDDPTGSYRHWCHHQFPGAEFQLDIPVTMLSAAGIKVPDAIVGRDLQTALDADDWEEEVLSQISESEVGRALRTALEI